MPFGRQSIQLYLGRHPEHLRMFTDEGKQQRLRLKNELLIKSHDDNDAGDVDERKKKSVLMNEAPTMLLFRGLIFGTGKYSPNQTSACVVRFGLEPKGKLVM